MGYRSTFVSSDSGITWPEWFRKKYESSIYFPPNPEDGLPCGCISSKYECKMYGMWCDLIEDITKVLAEQDHEFHLVILHEDGAITRYEWDYERKLLVLNPPF